MCCLHSKEEAAGNASTLSLAGEIRGLFPLWDEASLGYFVVFMFVHVEIVQWLHSLVSVPVILNNLSSNYHTIIWSYIFKRLTVTLFPVVIEARSSASLTE